MSFVYILKCADGTLYTGWTTDLVRRLKQHNSGVASKYTKVRLPVDLVYFEELATKSLALKREYSIKQLSRQAKLQLFT